MYFYSVFMQVTWYMVSSKEIEIDPDKIKAIQKMPAPMTEQK